MNNETRFAIHLSRSARRDRRQVGDAVRLGLIDAKLFDIAADPSGAHANVTALKGVEDGYRLRVGNWRISYAVDDAARVLTVIEIKPRGSAYR